MTPYTEDDVTPLSVWKHSKGGTYVALGIAICSTNGEGDDVFHVVVYHSIKYGRLRYRKASEFLDGRFQKVTE